VHVTVLTQRRQYLLFFGLVVGVVVLAFVVGRPRPSSSGLLDAVPADAWLVVTVDVASLRASPIAKPVLQGGEKTGIPGLGALTQNCGFDPLAKLKEVAIASPESGERGDFGVAFSGDFTRDELAACANNTIKARGGAPTTSTRGRFTVVEDTGDPLHSRVAYRDGGPFLVGRGAWLDAMMDAVEGKGARMRPEHARLRAALAPAKGAPPRAILLTAMLPSTLRNKLKAEMTAEVGDEAKANATFGAVLGVSSLGLGVSTGGEGSTTDLTAQFQCDSATACDEVKGFLERKRFALAKDLTMRLVGLGPLLDSFAVESHGASLGATAHAPSDDLARGLQRALDFTSARRGAGAGVGPGPGPGSEKR
jgi:hypothetical protein